MSTDESASAAARRRAASLRRAPPPHPRFGLAWKIFLGMAAVVAIVLAGALLSTARAASRAATLAVQRAVAASRQEVVASLDGRQRGLADGARVFVQNPAFRSLVTSRRREDVLDQTREAVDRLGATWVQVTDAQGRRIAKSDAPEARADTLAGSPLIAAALEGRSAMAFGTAGDTGIFYAVALPVEGAGAGSLAGTLMATRLLDDSAAQAIRASTGSDVAIYLLRDGRATIAATSLPRTPALERALLSGLTDARTRAGPAASAPAGATAVPPALTTIELGGEHYVVGDAPLRSAGGRVIGGVAVLRSRDAELAAFLDLRRTIVGAGSVGMLVALLVSLLLARQVTRRLGALVEATRNAAAGDYFAEVTVGGRDEVGVLADAFRAMLADLREKQVLVEFAHLSPSRAASRPAAAVTPDSPVLARGDAEAVTRRSRRTADAPPSPASSTVADSTPEPAPFTPDAPVPSAPDAIAAAAALRPGRRFGSRLQVHGMIGAGGTGVVFRATDIARGEVVALKVLRPDLVRGDPAALERLEREVRIARRLSHPNIVRVYDVGEVEGLHFMTMEYVEGSLLRDLIDMHGGLPLPAALAIVRQLCRALEHAHQHEVIHRDIKPQNLVVTSLGVLKIMDFGIARLAESPTGVTETGMLIGTPGYMAPEQLRGLHADARSDIYAVGVVLYECLTGSPPFPRASSPLMVFTGVLETPAPDPRLVKPDIPRALADVVLRTLAKDPAERPQTAEELYVALSGVD